MSRDCRAMSRSTKHNIYINIKTIVLIFMIYLLSEVRMCSPDALVILMGKVIFLSQWNPDCTKVKKRTFVSPSISCSRCPLWGPISTAVATGR